ncbi:MAG: OmpA family protein [Bacteroidia bacterium]|nr:OmpA family protein [Bacteroidia bacterium]
MKRLFKVLLPAILLPLMALSQTAQKPFALGLWGGLTQYNGDLGQGFYNSQGQDAHMHVGLTTAWYVASHFDFAMNATVGSFGYREDQLNNFEADQLQWNGHMRVSLFKEERFKINPYGFAGIGISYLNKLKRPGTDLYFPFGAGLKISLSDRFSLNLQETFAYTDHDNRDKEAKDNNDAFLMHSIGLSWNMACSKDADQDGVSDKKDKCPDTPAGVKVDNKGCPLDRDGDGIADFSDACPDLAGKSSAKGCPDKDGDSVTDSIDRCVEVAGLVTSDPATNGCPDRDGDGITDADDRCPDLKGSAALKGCPDSDEDGLIDPDDRCPQEKGLAALRGCPDRDADNIADLDDKCPDVAGIEANKGCPEVKEEVKQLFTQALQGIQFETGKAVIRKVSHTILDNVVKVMTENPAWLLEINGHTDSTGDKASNIDLSQRRADAVKAYLQGKGIAAERLTAKGYGDTVPVADNKSSAGRAKNRRVEFKINF